MISPRKQNWCVKEDRNMRRTKESGVCERYVCSKGKGTNRDTK